VRTDRAYLATLAELHRVADPDERRRIWRQGMAALAAATEHEAAPLEGLDPPGLLAAVRVALAEGLLLDLSFLSPAGAASATFALASALPPGAERRELGRRVLTRLREGDAATFVALAAALALTSVRALAEPAIRARLAAALAAPPPGASIGALALTLVSRPELEHAWLTQPATGSLPSRRLAARLLERAAREAARRHAEGDRGAVGVFRRPTVRSAWWRLLADRESLVWRHAAIARGLLAPRDHDLALAIDGELRPAGGPSDWRRGGTSLAAAMEVDPAFALPHLRRAIATLCPRDAGVAKAIVWGLGGALALEPRATDQLVTELVAAGGQEAIEAIADLRREGGVLPAATAAAAGWLERAVPADRGDDDGRIALLHALRQELTGDAGRQGGTLAAAVAAARAALTSGDVTGALRRGRDALDEVAATVDWLERAGDDEPLERRHALRLLREIDGELLSDGTVGDVLALGTDAGVALRELGGLLERLEQRLVALEDVPETRSPVPHGTLRLARLRALVRLMDAEVPGDVAARRDRRIDVVRRLMARAPADRSPLARAVWAALARGWDALLRAEHAELSDLLLCLTTSVPPDDDLAVIREATMVPEVAAVLDAYVVAVQTCWRARDASARTAHAATSAQLARVAETMPVASSARVEAVRSALGRVARALERLTAVRSQTAVPRDALASLEAALGHLAHLGIGARRRLGMPAQGEPGSEAAIRSVAVALDRVAADGDRPDEAIAAAIDVLAAEQMPLVASAVGNALVRIAVLPRAASPGEEPIELPEPPLPSWLPLSRTIGGFYVMRPIGTGAGGSVFVACRVDERHRIGAEHVALKVPDYDGGAARNLSESEFEALFRQEAGALLSLPRHPNIAHFITFDAGARPKPILVMEWVRGPTLEHALEVGELDMAGALRIIDGIAAGLDAMHDARVAHLDLKPANVILRDGDGVPVLVDFGLAGRTLRPGCGSPHYGAPEVWMAKPPSVSPFAADAYAFACLAYEILTGRILVGGDSLTQILTQHLSGRAGQGPIERLAEAHADLAPLAEALLAALARDPAHRPSTRRLRDVFHAAAPALARRPWPLALPAS
jgi:eukaryotic-like serine/threonine-protein kinase